MRILTTDIEMGLRLKAPVLPLLKTAQERLRRQKRYARPLSKGGARKLGIEDLLEQAFVCISDLARPEAALMPVTSVATENCVHIEGCVTLEGADLAHDVGRGGRVTTYLLTLGYEQQQAFDRLGGDYAAHHVQTDLAAEVLFALGRQVFQTQSEQAPKGARLRRIPVQAGAQCGQRRYWDAGKVQALLGLIGGANLGVSVTETGCFRPFHSMLGLTITN